MKIVHSVFTAVAKEQKPKKPTKKEIATGSARRWAEIQRQRNFERAVAEHAEEIKEIQKVFPDWIPKRVIK